MKKDRLVFQLSSHSFLNLRLNESYQNRSVLAVNTNTNYITLNPQVCLPIISAENWKPATKTDQVIQALVALVNDPEPEHPLRADLAEEYSKDRKKFMKNAEEFTKRNSEKRPSD